MLELIAVASHCAAEGCTKSLSLALGTISLNLSLLCLLFFFHVAGSSLTVGIATTQTVLHWPQRCDALSVDARRETRSFTVLRNSVWPHISASRPEPSKYDKKAMEKWLRPTP